MKRNHRAGIRPAAALALFVGLAWMGCYFHGSGDGESGPPASLVVKSAMPGYAGTVKVSGEGMSDVIASIAGGGDAVTLKVPSGRSRTVALSFVGASAVLAGSATVDISAGTTVNVKIPLRLKSTKILVPDFANGRIVQTDDIAGTNWKAKTGTDFNASAGEFDFLPMLIDFDNRGRVYIMSYSMGTVLPAGFIRIPDIDRTSEFETLVSYAGLTKGSKISKSAVPKASKWKNSSLPGKAAVSPGLVPKGTTELESPSSFVVDRTNNYFYYAVNYDIMDGESLSSYGRVYRADVSGSTFSPTLVYDIAQEFAGSLPPDFIIDNIAVDTLGFLYAICDVSAGEDNVVVLRIDPSKPVGSKATIYTGESLQGMPENVGPPMDMKVKGNVMYVFCGSNDPEIPSGVAMIVVDIGMTYLGNFGTLSSGPSLSTQGEFFASYNPYRFVRGAFDSIYIIDDDPGGIGGDRIIKIDDMNGNGWTSYGSTGSGQGQFQFMYPLPFM